MKLSHWKQATPFDQMKVILMSIEGHLDNYLEGIGENQLQKALAHLKELGELVKFIKEGNTWE